jgi:hypothetical protein
VGNRPGREGPPRPETGERRAEREERRRSERQGRKTEFPTRFPTKFLIMGDLATVAQVKERLGLLATDVQYDGLLQVLITALSDRFERECGRVFGWTEGVVDEFAGGEVAVPVKCYPIWNVARFSLQTSVGAGWVERPDVDYSAAGGCVVILRVPLWPLKDSMVRGRVTYSGGFVLPGGPLPPGPLVPPGDPGAPPLLPAALSWALVEQVAFNFTNRDHLGLMRMWPAGGNYVQFADPDLLVQVRETLRRYRRIVL